MTRTKTGRRRAPRLPIERQGRLRGRLLRDVTILDLSSVGCLLRCDSLLDAGAILDLEIDLDEPGAPFLAKVRVAESSLEGNAGGTALAGLEFIGLPAHSDARLRHFLETERRRRQREDAAAR